MNNPLRGKPSKTLLSKFFLSVLITIHLVPLSINLTKITDNYIKDKSAIESTLPILYSSLNILALSYLMKEYMEGKIGIK